MHYNNKSVSSSTMTTMSLSRNSSSSNTSPHHHNRRASAAAAAAAAVAGRMGSWLLCFVAGCCLGHFHGRFFSSSSSGSGTAAFVYSPPTTTILTTTSMGTERRTSLATTNLSPHPKEGGDCLQNDGDGWHTIHVFYGKADDHLDENDAADAAYSYSYTEEEPSYIGSANDASVIVGATTTPASLLDDAQQQQQQEQQRQLRRQPLLEGEQQQQPRRRRRRQRWYSQARQDELVIALLRNKTDGYFVDLAANDAIQLSNTYALERYYHWRGVCIEPNPVYWHNLTTFRTCTTVAAVVGAERMQGME